MRHLLSLTESEKAKRDARITTPNRVVLYQFTLSAEDAKWAQQKDKDAYNLTDLAFQPHPQHRTFTKAIRAVLDRDEAWIRWKENGCPPFEVESLGEKFYSNSRKKLEQILAPLPPYRYPMGNAHLSELWKEVDGLTLSSLEGRVKLPDPEEFLSEELDKTTLSELPPAEQIEMIDEKASKDWRGLRLAMRTDMVGVAEAKGSLRKYLEIKRDAAKEAQTEVKEESTDESPTNESSKEEDIKQENEEEKKGEPMDIQAES
jgi:THO complex subunit 1